MSVPLSILGTLDLLAVAAEQSGCIAEDALALGGEPPTIAQRRKKSISSLAEYPPFQVSIQTAISLLPPLKIAPPPNRVKRSLSDPAPPSAVEKMHKLPDCDNYSKFKSAAGATNLPESGSRCSSLTRTSTPEKREEDWLTMKNYLASPPVTPTSDTISRSSPALLGGWEEPTTPFTSFTTISASARLQFSPISPLPRRYNQVLIPIPIRPTMPFSCSCTSL